MKDTVPHKTIQTSLTPKSRPAVSFDWQDWLPYLEGEDIPDEQSQVLIETLWSIVLTFVDLGFNVKSPSKSCGADIDLKAALEAAVLNSEHTKSLDPPQPQKGEDAA